MSRIKDKLRRPFGETLRPEDAYLSYYDVRLTKEDVDSLQKEAWLTDTAITFWEEYLEREELVKYPAAKIVLLRPTMQSMLMNTPDPLTLKEALPSFKGVTHIFLPVNNNRDVMTPEAGSHWSLLLVSVIDGVAFHYDSMSGGNMTHAEDTSRKLEILLGKKLRFMDMEDAPQQDNGNDCGVFVCLVMKHLLLSRLLKVDASKKVTMSMRDDHVNPVLGRKEMMRIVEEMRKEGERRRSRSTSPFRSSSSKSKSPPRVGEENEARRSGSESIPIR